MAQPALFRETFSHVGTDDEPFLVVNPAYKLSAARTYARNLLPALGAPTDEVSREILGFDEPTLARLRAAGQFGRT
jgi:crotonobetainyl-CoA:carnitine CoA-transferase CaiB-like acyl-CoA transferase